MLHHAPDFILHHASRDRKAAIVVVPELQLALFCECAPRVLLLVVMLLMLWSCNMGLSRCVGHQNFKLPRCHTASTGCVL
jgi:hypothetical protein